MVGCLQGKTCKGSFTRANDQLNGEGNLPFIGVLPGPGEILRRYYGGHGRNRTGVDGFAGRWRKPLRHVAVRGENMIPGPLMGRFL